MSERAPREHILFTIGDLFAEIAARVDVYSYYQMALVCKRWHKWRITPTLIDSVGKRLSPKHKGVHTYKSNLIAWKIFRMFLYILEAGVHDRRAILLRALLYYREPSLQVGGYFLERDVEKLCFLKFHSTEDYHREFSLLKLFAPTHTSAEGLYQIASENLCQFPNRFGIEREHYVGGIRDPIRRVEQLNDRGVCRALELLCALDALMNYKSLSQFIMSEELALYGTIKKHWRVSFTSLPFIRRHMRSLGFDMSGHEESYRSLFGEKAKNLLSTIETAYKPKVRKRTRSLSLPSLTKDKRLRLDISIYTCENLVYVGDLRALAGSLSSLDVVVRAKVHKRSNHSETCEISMRCKDDHAAISVPLDGPVIIITKNQTYARECMDTLEKHFNRIHGERDIETERGRKDPSPKLKRVK